MRGRALSLILAIFITPAWADRISEDAALAAARTGYLNPPWRESLSGTRAKRNGEELVLPLTQRPPLNLTSNTPPCTDTTDLPVDSCVVYRLVADLATRHIYIVAKTYYEGCMDVLLIDDRTGRQSVMADIPSFSPDDQRLFLSNDCVADASASDNRLEIWRRAPDGWQLEWAYKPTADSPLAAVLESRAITWDGKNRLSVCFAAGKTDSSACQIRAEIAQGSAGWTIRFDPRH